MWEGDANGTSSSAHRSKRLLQPQAQPRDQHQQQGKHHQREQQQQKEQKQQQQQQKHMQREIRLNTGLTDSQQVGDASLSAWSCLCIPPQSRMPSDGGSAADPAAAAVAAYSSCSTASSCSSASLQASQLPLFREGQQQQPPAKVRDEPDCESVEEGGEDEATAAAATSAPASTVLCALPDLGGVVGGLVNLFGGGWLADRFSALMRESLQSMLLLLLRLQRQQLLRRFCPDLMERYTHTLSGGQFKAERHSIRTTDGYEVHFYLLRRVTRWCCTDDCGCEVLGGTAAAAPVAGTTAEEAARSPASAALANASSIAPKGSYDTVAAFPATAPPLTIGGSSSSSNSLDGDCRGQVFVFVHGLLESSLNWISGGFLSLPFIAAQRGGEVWLVNSRGNEYTRELSAHKQQQPQQQLPQQQQQQEQQQDASGLLSGELQEDDRYPSYSLATLHAFIQEKQQQFLRAQEQQQTHRNDDEQQQHHLQQLLQQKEQYEVEGDCCSIVCCRCSGLTAFPSLRGKSQEEQNRLLKDACMQASALLLNMHWGSQNPTNFGNSSQEEEQQEQQQQPFNRTPSESELSTALSSSARAFAESDGGVNMPSPSASLAATAATPAPGTAPAPAAAAGCLASCFSSDDLLHSLRSCGDCRGDCSLRDACACPCMGSRREEGQPLLRAGAGAAGRGAARQQQTGTAAFACNRKSTSPKESSWGDCGAKVGWDDDEHSNNTSRWLPRIRSGASSKSPPFAFSASFASGSWSFQEMALFDLPAQLQYIAQHSQTLNRRRAAMLAAATSSTNSNSSSVSDSCSIKTKSAFGCGLVAIGQSQGAAQLLIALSSSPSLGLLLRRAVLFSPPLILQPLQQLPYSARVLLLLGMRHPTLLLQALKFFVRFIPERLLSTAGNAIVGSGKRGGMRFYNTPLQQQQLFLNFAHTPSGNCTNLAVASAAVTAPMQLCCVQLKHRSVFGGRQWKNLGPLFRCVAAAAAAGVAAGGTSRQNFAHWMQQLNSGEPLSSLSPGSAVLASSLLSPSSSPAESSDATWLTQLLENATPQRNEWQQQQQQEQQQECAALPGVDVVRGRYPLERISSFLYAFLGAQDNLVQPGQLQWLQ